MLHIAICDDQPAELREIRRCVQEYFDTMTERSAEIHAFQNPMDFLDYLEGGGQCDIALLDICMPGIDGIQIGKEIRAKESRTEIIFFTTSRDFAVDAFELKAAHYIIKPVTREHVNEAMNRAMKSFGPQERGKVVLQGEGGILRVVSTDTIIYVENFHHHRAVYTTAGEMKETRRTLTAMAEELEQLCPGMFIMPYRGYIVNQNAIRAVTKEGILLQNDVRIPIKNGDFRRLRDAYVEWAFREVGDGE